MGHPRISSEGTGRGVEEALAALVTSSAFPAINLDFVPPNSASFESRSSAARASGPAPGGRPRSAAPARLSRRGKEGGGAERAAQPVRASQRVDSRRLRGPRDRPSPAGRLRGPAVGTGIASRPQQRPEPRAPRRGEQQPPPTSAAQQPAPPPRPAPLTPGAPSARRTPTPPPKGHRARPYKHPNSFIHHQRPPPQRRPPPQP